MLFASLDFLFTLAAARSLTYMATLPGTGQPRRRHRVRFAHLRAFAMSSNTRREVVRVSVVLALKTMGKKHNPTTAIHGLLHLLVNPLPWMPFSEPVMRAGTFVPSLGPSFFTKIGYFASYRCRYASNSSGFTVDWLGTHCSSGRLP